MAIALIDADLLVYRVGFTTEEVDEAIARWRMDEVIHESILKPLNAERYKCYITSSDHSNFRFQLFAQYKGNRVAPKPRHYEALRDHLRLAHEAEVVFGEEADDRLGIDAAKDPDNIICSIDKDLKQIPGRHFNFVKGELFEVSAFDGMRFFYIQLLTGDKPVDNIEGIHGIGPKKAEKILAGLETEQQMYDAVLEAYKKHYPSDYLERMLLAGRLLKIRTKEGEIWQLRESISQA